MGPVFKIKGKLYEVQNLMFNFYHPEHDERNFDARLIINTREAPPIIVPHIQIPDEMTV